VSDSAGMFGFPVFELPASDTLSPDATIRFLVGELVKSGRIEPMHADRVVCQVLKRESQGSTAIGRGFALPHSKSDAVSEVQGVVGQAVVPVSWPGAVGVEAVRVVCLLVTPAQDSGKCLRALEAVSRRMKDG
jgi:mannitol/fructose-specific phosphotransferase system IIA component (Ntr-type)